ELVGIHPFASCVSEIDEFLGLSPEPGQERISSRGGPGVRGLLVLGAPRPGRRDRPEVCELTRVAEGVPCLTSSRAADGNRHSEERGSGYASSYPHLKRSSTRAEEAAPASYRNARAGKGSASSTRARDRRAQGLMRKVVEPFPPPHAIEFIET